MEHEIMENKNKYIEAAIKELMFPTLLITEQYLQEDGIEIVYENEFPKVGRVGLNYIDGQHYAMVFFPIKNKRFYLVVTLAIESTIRIQGVYVEGGHTMYLRATSNKLTFEELSAVTTLQPLEGRTIGEPSGFKRKLNQLSSLSYYFDKNRAYSFEEKLDLLLTKLETDRKAIIKLTEHPEIDVWIEVARYLYIDANKGLYIDKQTMKRLNELNLGLSISQYTTGLNLKEN